MSKQGNSSDKKRESLSGSYSGVIPNFSDSFEAKTASYYSLTLTLYLKNNQDKTKFSGMIGYHRSDMACGSLWPFPSSRQFRKPQNSRTKIYLPNQHS